MVAAPANIISHVINSIRSRYVDRQAWMARIMWLHSNQEQFFFQFCNSRRVLRMAFLLCGLGGFEIARSRLTFPARTCITD